MTDATSSDAQKTTEDWWRTSIIDMSPGTSRLPRVPHRRLDSLKAVSLAQMIWLMTRGELRPAPKAYCWRPR